MYRKVKPKIIIYYFGLFQLDIYHEKWYNEMIIIYNGDMCLYEL
jgi:hypothetical protein